MRVRTKLTIFFILVFMVSVNNSFACSSDSECYPGYCYTRTSTCVNTCGIDGCQANYGENCGTCNQDCACGSGQSCVNNQCVVSCVQSCSLGSTYCSGNKVKTCIADGCGTKYDDGVVCPSGYCYDFKCCTPKTCSVLGYECGQLNQRVPGTA